MDGHIKEYLQREKKELKERGDIEAVSSGINAEWL